MSITWTISSLIRYTNKLCRRLAVALDCCIKWFDIFIIWCVWKILIWNIWKIHCSCLVPSLPPEMVAVEEGGSLSLLCPNGLHPTSPFLMLFGEPVATQPHTHMPTSAFPKPSPILQPEPNYNPLNPLSLNPLAPLSWANWGTSVSCLLLVHQWRSEGSGSPRFLVHQSSSWWCGRLKMFNLYRI